MDKNPEKKRSQLKALAKQKAMLPKIDVDAWLANKPRKFAEIMRGLIAAARWEYTQEWAEKVAAFNPDVRQMYVHTLQTQVPKRAAELLPLIDLNQFSALAKMQCIPVPNKTPNQTENQPQR